MKTHGFPMQQKLARADEYRRVFKHGRRSADACFVVLASPNQAGFARLGLAIARKHVPTAVARNRIKRLVREHFRLCQSALPAVDIIVMSRRSTAEADTAGIRASLDKHWNRTRQQ